MKKEPVIISFSARKKWLSIPAEVRRAIEKNVWCSSCMDTVQIENYEIKESQNGIILLGTCKNCGNDVVRVVD